MLRGYPYRTRGFAIKGNGRREARFRICVAFLQQPAAGAPAASAAAKAAPHPASPARGGGEDRASRETSASLPARREGSGEGSLGVTGLCWAAPGPVDGGGRACQTRTATGKTGMATASTERNRVAPVLAAARNAANIANGGVGAAALLGLLGWIALSIHEMNARLGVVETRLIAVEESQAGLKAELKAGLAQASEERRALEDRLGARIDDAARRLPPPR